VVISKRSSVTFQTYNGLIERNNILATEIAMNIENLVNNLESRKSEGFVTTEVNKN
jgi:hypothetical protein